MRGLSICIFILFCCATEMLNAQSTKKSCAGCVSSVSIITSSGTGDDGEYIRNILAREISSRCNACIIQDNDSELRIELLIENQLAPESFKITDADNKTIRIIGGDKRGLIYGIGKFLHSSSFGKGFVPGAWRGDGSPSGTIRGIYFATHFGNFYEAAPIDQVQEYLDELALWGINYLLVVFPRWHFTGFDDPAAQQSLIRLKQLMRAAKRIGMKVALSGGNDNFKSTPKEFLRVPVPDPLKRRGDFGVNLDPSNPAAHEMMMRDWARLMDEFSDPGLDGIVFAPYDEGGCGCDKCWPWGARGYPKLCRDLAQITRAKFSESDIILSTWTFDTPPAGEWEGLSQFLKMDSGWANYILADSHEDYPRYPLDYGTPGNLPLLNFPEISMWSQSPWGGYGANPYPGRLQNLWNQTENKVSGGFPYSEGIYEDINKVICSQLYWDRNRPTQDIVKEYLAYEFSPDIVEEVAEAIHILESNHDRKHIESNSREAFRLMEKADKKLRPEIRMSWRWRILYLRALIDREMYVNKGKLKGEKLKRAFNELTLIYHAENSHSMSLHPPVIE